MQAPNIPQYAAEPWVRLDDGQVVGWEFLWRGPRPACWQAQDQRLLEHLAVDTAPGPGLWSVNLDVRTILAFGDGRMDDVMARIGPQLVVEWTEQHGSTAQITQAGRLLRQWRSRHGIKLAVDDVGSGQDAIERLLASRPDFAKIDGRLLRKARHSHWHADLMRHLCQWMEKHAIAVVGEWLETPQDLAVARNAGIPIGQGRYFHEGLAHGRTTTYPKLG